MSLFLIALRSIQQRGVASLLTMLSMALGVMLVVGVLSIHGVVAQSFRNNASLGYNIIIGAKGGKEQLTLNTVYYLSAPVENIPYTYYAEFLKKEERDRLLAVSYAAEGYSDLKSAAELSALTSGGTGGLVEELAIDKLGTKLVPDVTDKKMAAPPVELGRHGRYGQMTDLAIPLCLGDYFGRFRVVGTTPALFNDLVYDLENNRKFEFAQGRNFVWHDPQNGFFEAVVGSAVAREMKVKVGDKFSAAHGEPGGHEHQQQFTIVGILKASGTPNDRAAFVNMEGFYLMEDHARPLDKSEEEKPQANNKAEWDRLRAQQELPKTPSLAAAREPLPAERREVTAILVKVDPMFAPGIESSVNDGPDAQAVLPVAVITGLFEFIVSPINWILLLLTAMICIVSGISILVSIYNSMSERRGEIAVMRALGAGRGTVMGIILLEATLLALGGGALGWLLGHLGTLIASPWIEEHTGVLVGFLNLSTLPAEAVLIPALIVLAILVGLWPAISAYRTDVARSLGK
jgi:putative ABC transport system permease protein